MNPDHLLEQAERLIRPEAGRPRQADLRRAASACYYALFHRLIELACQRIVGGKSDRADTRHVLSRAFSHGEMKEASRTFAGGTLPKFLAGQFAGAAAPPKVKKVAGAFVRLQTERHMADYDRSQSLTQADVETLIELAKAAVKLAAGLWANDHGRLYLLALLTWNKLRR